MLMALQITRGKDFKAMQNTVVNYFSKMQIAVDSRDPQVMRQRLKDADLEATQENLDLLREMMDEPDSYGDWELRSAHQLLGALETAVDLLPYLAGRTWSVGVLTDPRLITTDHPLIRHAEPGSVPPVIGVGYGTADEVWMPLDPLRILVMTHPDKDSIVGGVPPETVEGLNRRIAVECHEWVFARRDNPQIEGIAVSLGGTPPPTMEIQGPTPSEWGASARKMQGLDDG